MWGHTHSVALDGALDEISRRDRERQTATDALIRLTTRHPELEHDDDLVAARLALLR